MRKLTANQRFVLNEIATAKTMPEDEAYERLGKNANGTLKALYSRKLIGRTGRGRGQPFRVTDAGKAALTVN
jgi:hypothetical protein